MKKFLQTFLLFFLIANFNVLAKDSKAKFGKVSAEDVAMTSYEADTSAHAVVLNEWGEIFFDFNSSNLNYQLKLLKRIKILTKEGLQYANISIPLYQSGSAKESIGSIKGFTYNLENGDVEKIKLDKSSIHRETTSDYVETIKVTFPNVKPGSVIEIQYSLTSNLFVKLRSWNFQDEIPVRESQYSADIPEYFDYTIHQKGYEVLHTSNVEKISRDGLSLKRYLWKAVNMPAFKSEPFMLSGKSFLTGLDFELSRIDIPGYVFEDYSSTWQSVKMDMLSSDGLGTELSGGAFFKDVVDEIESSASDDLSKLLAAYEYIQQNMKWNERYSIYPTEKLRKSFNDKEGNCADINLMLVVLLNKLGIESHPVLLCSRSKGLFNMLIAKRTSFNYMIAVANIDGKEVLIDATDRVCKCGDLPFRCLNSQGLKLAPGPVSWVDLDEMQARKLIMCQIDLTDIEEVKGKISYRYNDYSAYLFRKGIEDKNDDEIITEFEEGNEWLTVEDFSMKESDDNKQAVVAEYTCTMDGFFEDSGDNLYINPFIVERQETNPLTLPERKYPVDFGFSQSENLIFMIKIPEGYEADVLPEPKRVILPNNAGSFTYGVNNLNGTIQVVSKVDINKAVFAFNEYSFLVEFFNQIVNKQSEMIVLKKQI